MPRIRRVFSGAIGDLRDSANRVCWPEQEKFEKALYGVLASMGVEVERLHPPGFIASQAEGLAAFGKIPAGGAALLPMTAWAYAQFAVPALVGHDGPILLVANKSGTWPGMVGMLSAGGYFDAVGTPHSRIWSPTVDDAEFKSQIQAWVESGGEQIPYDTSHIRRLADLPVPDSVNPGLGAKLADSFRPRKGGKRVLMLVFDEFCMGMGQAVVPDKLCWGAGFAKERASQSALYYEAKQVKPEEAEAMFDWLVEQGAKFEFGEDPAQCLTKDQVLWQCRTAIAAARLADDFGADYVLIQYQQGLKDVLPASDLAEGILNTRKHPPFYSRDGKRELFKDRAVICGNEADECMGMGQWFWFRTARELGLPEEVVGHDFRWLDEVRIGKNPCPGEEVHVWELSGPTAAGLVGGWKNVTVMRQPGMYFPLGGGAMHCLGKPGWHAFNRVYVDGSDLRMIVGVAEILKLDARETKRRWESTTPQWPLFHARIPGVPAKAWMRFKSNHITSGLAGTREQAVNGMFAMAQMAEELGVKVEVWGDPLNGN